MITATETKLPKIKTALPGDSQEKCCCGREGNCRLVDRRKTAETCEKRYLIDAIKPGTQIRRAKLARHTRTNCYAIVFEEVKVLHLRFHRTFPSFVSSIIIPRSMRSFLTRSATT